MQPTESEQTAAAGASEQSDSPIYRGGFATVFSSERYAVFSRLLARLALALLEEHGAPGRRLLDLACGAGVGSEVLAEAGYQVLAVDSSSDMVRCTRERAAAKSLAIDVLHQDMRRLSVPFECHVVTCLFDSLNYLLEESELAEVFVRVADSLAPDGLFVFDMNTPHGLATRWGTRDVLSTARQDLFEFCRNRFDADQAINTTTSLVFVRDEATGLFRLTTEIHRERGYEAETLRGLIENAGFSVVAVSGLGDLYAGISRRLQPLSGESGRIVMVARKRGAGAVGRPHGRG